jgi:hypothetical protein
VSFPASGSHRNKANRHKISYKSGRYPNLQFWLSECKNLFIQSPTDLVRLWQHEAARVYRDKLVDEKDLESYDKLLKDVIKKSFEVKRGIIYLT